MVRARVDFDDVDRKVLVALAEHYARVSPRFSAEELMEAVQMEWEPLRRILWRFSRYDLVNRELLIDGEWTIQPKLLAVADQLKHGLSPRDFSEELSVWLRSKWWSIPLLVLTVVVPAIFSYFSMIVSIMNWSGGGR